MTEQEWLASEDPARMLQYIGPLNCKVSDRKLRLFGCACCRQVWHLLSDVQSRKAVELAEQYADGDSVAGKELRRVDALPHMDIDITGTVRAAPYYLADLGRLESVLQTVSGPRLGWPGGNLAFAANLLRDIVGNPFRPVQLPLGLTCQTCGGDGEIGTLGGKLACHTCSPGALRRGTGRQPSPWLTPDVLSLAQAAYEERRHLWSGMVETEMGPEFQSVVIDDGTLDSARLAVLSDALEEAGCSLGCTHCVGGVWGEYADGDHTPILCSTPSCALLYHLRSPGPHVRSCWAVDLLLGKE